MLCFYRFQENKTYLQKQKHYQTFETKRFETKYANQNRLIRKLIPYRTVFQHLGEGPSHRLVHVTDPGIWIFVEICPKIVDDKVRVGDFFSVKQNKRGLSFLWRFQWIYDLKIEVCSCIHSRWNSTRIYWDIFFPLFIRKEIKTRKSGRKLKHEYQKDQ